MNLENVFKSITEKLMIDFNFASSEIKHNFSKGHVREIELASQFLDKYMPKNIGITRGEIISSNNEVSNECDLIFYEKNGCPFLLDKEGYRIIPIEFVYGVLEVKSNLNSSELLDSYNKISTVKKFKKEAYSSRFVDIKPTTLAYGKEWEIFPTTGFIFAYNSIKLTTLKDRLTELQKDTDLHNRIDSVWVLDKGMIINYNSTADSIPELPSNETILRCVNSENPLMMFVVHLQSIFQSGILQPKFLIQKYLKHVEFGKFSD